MVYINYSNHSNGMGCSVIPPYLISIILLLIATTVAESPPKTGMMSFGGSFSCQICAQFRLEISSPAAPETEPPPNVGLFFGGEVGTVGYCQLEHHPLFWVHAQLSVFVLGYCKFSQGFMLMTNSSINPWYAEMFCLSNNTIILEFLQEWRGNRPSPRGTWYEQFFLRFLDFLCISRMSKQVVTQLAFQRWRSSGCQTAPKDP